MLKPRSMYLCLLLLNISRCESFGRWPWSLFRKIAGHYDKDVENKAKLTTDGWIKMENFPCEVHNIVTDDGYILVLYRIPRPGHQPALLVHGLLTSSLSFVLLGSRHSLAFQFASQKFDVWLLNTRGAAESRNHTHFSNRSPLFWQFSVHEIGLYDVSATINFIRNVTTFHQVVYVGHSQGATSLFVLCSLRPEYNDNILLMHALGPVVFLKDLSKYSQETVKMLKDFIKKKKRLNSFEIFSRGRIFKDCSIKSRRRGMCVKLMRDIFGAGQYNESLDPIVLGSAIGGGSLREIEHYLQIFKWGDFRAYDYDMKQNKEVYHSVEPTEYDLAKISFPVILHYGRTDALATSNAIHRLYKELKNLVGLYAVGADKFNHFDFVWSSLSGTLVGDKILKQCDDFLRGDLKYQIE